MKASYIKPLLPLRDIVIFPSMVVPLFVGRDKSISALNEVMKKEKKIILVTQKNSEIDDPKKTDIFMYGCEGSILQLLKLPDGTVKVLVEGIKRVKILDFKDNEKFITCDYTHYNDVSPKDEDLFPLAATALRRLEKLTSINKKISNETINTIKQLKDPSQIADNIASHITATISEKQQIFETVDVKKRLNAIIKIMENETSIIGVEKRIRGRVKTQMEKTQREYYLNEQLKAIQKELGEIEDGKDETTSLNKAITKAKKSLITVPLINGTIPHEVKHKFKAAKILLMPAAPGTGIIAGGSVRKVVGLAGVSNIMGKSLGSNNKLSTTRAAFEALKLLKENPYIKPNKEETPVVKEEAKEEKVAKKAEKPKKSTKKDAKAEEKPAKAKKAPAKKAEKKEEGSKK